MSSILSLALQGRLFRFINLSRKFIGPVKIGPKPALYFLNRIISWQHTKGAHEVGGCFRVGIVEVVAGVVAHQNLVVTHQSGWVIHSS